MPKMKTHKSTKRRFKVTGTGKLMRTKIGKSHLRRKKPSRTRRLFDEYLVVTDKATIKRVRRLAPILWKR
ncbi:MAG: 50S ribosomal protein L35 [Ardenticatenales bacterium]|jgi:large subunit ribosomal protein L35|nr:50S ribosomal protein L35 [Ardenticatenales bacterium]MCC7021016.1 50S ribosomal protein L35 [Ardenticatenales bacterium]